MRLPIVSAGETMSQPYGDFKKGGKNLFKCQVFVR